MTQKELILILGGARAGKSTFALRLAAERGDNICFIATAEALDEEMRLRVAAHRAERPTHWQTIEEPKQLGDAIKRSNESEIVIVDCLTFFVSNWLMSNPNQQQAEQDVLRVFEDFLSIVSLQNQTVICVSNEVGLGVVPDNELGRSFRDALGRVNQMAAAASNRVYLLVAGLPLQIKPTKEAR